MYTPYTPYTPPVIVPVIIHSEPDRCPQCKKEEDIISICCNCGYEYKEDGDGPIWLFILIIIISLIIGGWFIFTIMSWFGSYNHDTLFEIIGDQFKWLSELRVW